MNGRSCGQYLMFGVLISRTCENDGSHRCRPSQRISSSWALMLVVAKEQFLMFHQAEGRCLLDVHQELGSNLIWSSRFPFSSDLFICLWWLCWLLRQSDNILVVRLKQKNPSSSPARCTPAACDDRIWIYSGPGPGQFSDGFFFCDNHQDGGCRYQKNDQSLTLPLETCLPGWVVAVFFPVVLVSVWWPL